MRCMSERETPPTLSITPTKKKRGANVLAYIGLVALFGPFIAVIVILRTFKPTSPDEIPANPAAQFEPVRKPLTEAEKKVREQEALKKAKADMKNFTGDGDLKVAVSRAELTLAGVDPKKAENYRFAFLKVAIRNSSSKTVQIDPSKFTLLDGEGLEPFPSTVEDTKIIDRLKKTSLAPAKECTGWLIFIVPKSKKYTLQRVIGPDTYDVNKVVVP